MSDLFQLANINVIVTGVGGSIRTQISLLLAKAGANLLLSDSSAEALCSMLLYRICNISQEDIEESLVKHFNKHSSVDVISNSASVFPSGESDTVKVFYKHTVLSIRRHRKTKGITINTPPIVKSISSATTQIAYTTSKGAIIAITQEPAIMHTGEGTQFNALCPSSLNTPLIQHYLSAKKVHLPQGRFRKPIEQAAVALLLVGGSRHTLPHR
ncbi:uncharacterized protein LY79DRAFT_698125 [Colletotrichum navitas]|uniref:Uncharacterized protein n=1 Tax=Colletotrichum navitas TaxID=681940 RepID=A0AAD8PN57_9PEZI|nr:uncharacterized protein LY79DRAFT_698125 [Colletotrichum navitas]KAK1573063.1 hypothetical protein LY79DRAFT_698125 [Colletotrichum navitas]